VSGHRYDVSSLRQQLRGEVLVRDDAGFDEARTVWNARFDRSPGLIARCAGSDDVAAAVRHARTHALDVSVKGGGHAYAGNTVVEDSLLIDLGSMRTVSVDAPNRRATVGGGCTWADVDSATTAHGLATPGGTVSSVGVGGVTLGGGSGWLSRKYGLAADNLRAAEVVTAAGAVVEANERENSELLWALCGGGGNFGIVTSFEFELHPVPSELVAGQIVYPADRAAELLRLYRDYIRDAPDEVMCYPFVIRVPPIDVFPEAWHGTLALDFVVAYVGPPDEGMAHLQPFREPGDPILDFVAAQPYTALQQSFDAGLGYGNRWYSRSTQMDELSDAAIDTIVDRLPPLPGAFSIVYLGPTDGAASRPAPDAIAYPHRSSNHEFHILAGWSDPAEDGEVMAWTDAFHSAMLGHGNGHVYVNLLGDGEEERVRDAYASNYQRLARLKEKWDPDNVFRGNHNIQPAG
jgi:FAD/FMN-containing dehydrogenase